jgi:hypothetical protein
VNARIYRKGQSEPVIVSGAASIRVDSANQDFRAVIVYGNEQKELARFKLENVDGWDMAEPNFPQAV